MISENIQTKQALLKTPATTKNKIFAVGHQILTAPYAQTWKKLPKDIG